MTDRSAETSPLVYARASGLAYVIVILLGIVGVGVCIESNIVAGDNAATVANIRAHELLFRAGIAAEIIMYVLVVFLSLALYAVLKTVDNTLALLALLWRLGEAIVGASVAVISGLIPLLLLHGEAAFGREQSAALVGLFLAVRGAGLDVVLLFIGMGGTVFCYLFFTSKYVPRILAAWGMATYLSMLLLALLSILLADFPEAIKMAFYAPGALFEILFGLWLLVKGVNIEQWHARAAGSS